MASKLIGLAKATTAAENYVKTYEFKYLAELSHYLSHPAYKLQVGEDRTAVQAWMTELKNAIPIDLLVFLSGVPPAWYDPDFDAARFHTTVSVVADEFLRWGWEIGKPTLWAAPRRRALLPIEFAPHANNPRVVAGLKALTGATSERALWERWPTSTRWGLELLQILGKQSPPGWKLAAISKIRECLPSPGLILCHHLAWVRSLPLRSKMEAFLAIAAAGLDFLTSLEATMVPREPAEQAKRLAAASKNPMEWYLEALGLFWRTVSMANKQTVALSTALSCHGVPFGMGNGDDIVIAPSDVQDATRQLLLAYLDAVLESFQCRSGALIGRIV